MKKILLLYLIISSIGCSKKLKVGECVKSEHSAWHIIRIIDNTVELINLDTKQLGIITIEELKDFSVVNCLIAHEVMEQK